MCLAGSPSLSSSDVNNLEKFYDLVWLIASLGSEQQPSLSHHCIEIYSRICIKLFTLNSIERCLPSDLTACIRSSLGRDHPAGRRTAENKLERKLHAKRTLINHFYLVTVN